MKQNEMGSRDRPGEADAKAIVSWPASFLAHGRIVKAAVKNQAARQRPAPLVRRLPRRLVRYSQTSGQANSPGAAKFGAAHAEPKSRPDG